MAVVDIIRPATVPGSVVNTTITGGSANVALALGDVSNATYLTSTVPLNGSAVTAMSMVAHAIPANHLRHQFRVFIRATPFTAGATPYRVDGRIYDNAVSTLLGSVSVIWPTPPPPTLNTFADYVSAWVNVPANILAVTPYTFGATYDTAGLNNLPRLSELWAEIDNRARPTFTLAVLDGDMVAADPLILSNNPTLQFNAVALDGLPARSWRAALYTLATTLLGGFTPFQAGGLLWSDGAAGAVPATLATTPLPNDDYVVYTEITSTVAADTAHPSAIVSDGFEVAVPVPPAPTVVATVTAQTVEVCVTDNSAASEWDGQIVFTINRHDTANPDGIIVAVSDPIWPDSDGVFCWDDCFAPLCPPTCGTDCEDHDFYYTASITGEVGGYEVTTDPGTSLAVSVLSPGYHRIISADCQVIIACMDGWGSWARVRPNQVWRPAVGGLPYVTVGDPGGRDWSLRFAVEAADIVALELLLAAAVFYWSPPTGVGAWLAPISEAVSVQTAGGTVSYSVSCVEVTVPV